MMMYEIEKKEHQIRDNSLLAFTIVVFQNLGIWPVLVPSSSALFILPKDSLKTKMPSIHSHHNTSSNFLKVAYFANHWCT
mmetsp:Transcript_12258/g.16379  ORF Transcript_12258/g.16379 Transcript_12258/m.16379 type:complete len:80 (-) Transcript_12258:168-407(-)